MMLLKLVITMLCVLLAVAYLTLAERKILSYVQTRKGPNKVGLMGLLQPIADAMKLFLKEFLKPSSSNFALFSFFPLGALSMTLALWYIIPSWYATHFVTLSLLLFLCISALNVYVVLGAGWASNSSYAFLGALRGSAQTISYEVSLVFILLMPLFCVSTLSATHLLCSYPVIVLFLPLTLMWFVTCLAETNRAPFDFAEGESELVSGFNVEYGGGMFALLFLAEYASILLISALTYVCFFPSTSSFLYVSGTLFVVVVILICRGVYPRQRYDLLMMLCWKSFLPVGLSFLGVSGGLLLIF